MDHTCALYREQIDVIEDPAHAWCLIFGVLLCLVSNPFTYIIQGHGNQDDCVISPVFVKEPGEYG